MDKSVGIGGWLFLVAAGLVLAGTFVKLTRTITGPSRGQEDKYDETSGNAYGSDPSPGTLILHVSLSGARHHWGSDGLREPDKPVRVAVTRCRHSH